MVAWGRAPPRGACSPPWPGRQEASRGSDEEVGPAHSDAERGPGAAAPVCSECLRDGPSLVHSMRPTRSSGHRWANHPLGEVPRGDGQRECLGQLGKGQRLRLLRVWGTHTRVLTISSAPGVQGRCQSPGLAFSSAAKTL